MKNQVSRRQFIKNSGLFVGAGMTFPLLQTFAADSTTSPVTSPERAFDFAPPGSFKVEFHGRFAELPVGSVTPRGWIKSWLQRQAEGLTGHPETMAYPYDTYMYAGKIPPPLVHHGSNWWPYEQSGYFLDGAVRLSHLTDNPEAGRTPRAGLNYILTNSRPGKLGESSWGWPNAVAGRALMAEYSATGNAKVAQTLNTCILGSRSFTGRDGLVAEEALYLYGLAGDPRLLAVAQHAYNQIFIDDPKSTLRIDKIRSDEPLRDHGVTAAEKLKLLPLMFCYTGNKEMLDLAKRAFGKVEGDSLMPDGCFVSAEHLNTTAFNSLHETCDITDWSWALGYMLMASGDAHWADRIEQMIFNALPGVVTKDFKQVQYFSSANQILCSNTACPTFAVTRMSYRAAHETECCAGNVNRAMPNYVTRMWMRTDTGLAATLFGPSQVSIDINGERVTIIEETDYPFRGTISFKIEIANPAKFTLELRIPEWCDAATVMINKTPSDVDAKAGTFAILKREFHDGDLITLNLPMDVQLKDWFDGNAVSVHRGPLVYSMKIEERRVASTRDPAAIRAILKGNNIQQFPAIEFFPASEWRYGLDAAQKNMPSRFKVIESPMTDNPFLADSSPIAIEVPLRALPQWEPEWTPVLEPAPADLKLSPKNPVALPDNAGLRSAGESRNMQFLPYGATHLRLTTLPVIKN